ncbi:GrpB family protein [Patescibacteria group bacterium]
MSFYPHVPYNRSYQKLYELEIDRIKSVLGNVIIEHFGSTAVKGLGGKGYIDIYVVVPKKQPVSTSKLIQEELCCGFMPTGGKDSERLFHLTFVTILPHYLESKRWTYYEGECIVSE